MRAALIVVAFVSALFTASQASAQVYIHDDFGGHSVRVGSMVQSYRNDGTVQTYQRFGQMHRYYDNTGTSGFRYYGPSGMIYNYSNSNRGYYNSGYAPYYRTYNPLSPRNYPLSPQNHPYGPYGR